MDLFIVSLTLILATVILYLRSPLFLSVPLFLLAGAVRLSLESDLAEVAIFMSWFFLFITIALILRHKNIAINRFYVEQTRPTQHGITYRDILFLLFILFIVVLWLVQARVFAFESIKRIRIETGPLFNMANSLIVSLSCYMLMVFGLGRNLSRKHYYFAFLCLGITMAVGFLSSGRGAIIFPVLTMGGFAVLNRAKYQLSTVVKVVLGVVTVVIFTTYLVLQITMTRSGGIDSLGEAWVTFAEQLASSEMGNGLSPKKERMVVNYAERMGAVLPAYSLLSGVYGFVPRAVWSAKPDVGTGPFVGREIFNVAAGVPISVPAEFALVFGGTLGYVLGFLISGIVLAFIGLLLSRAPLLLLPYVMVLPNGLLGSGIGRTQMSFIMVALGVMAIQELSRIRVRYERI